MASKPYSKKISFEVIKKGRKYFQIRYSPEHNAFQLLINDLTRDFQVGQIVTDLLCEFETQFNSYTGGKKTTAIAVDSETFAKRAELHAEAERQSEIQRWRGYVDEKLTYGQIYQRGLNELRSLGFDISVYADQIAAAQEAERQSEIQRWSGYCEASAIEGRDYVKGLRRLTELGAPDVADQYRKQAAEVRAEKEQVAAEQKRENEHEQGTVDYWFGSPAWTQAEELAHLNIGDIYKGRDGQYYKILTRSHRYIREDGLSFGLADDSGEIVEGKARFATEEESAPLIAAEQAARLQKENRAAAAKERKAISDQIKACGDRPQHHCGELLLSTVNLYGGGDWFEINESAIWYCKNNGHDGDDWSLNNVSTWGAGAIGWRIPYDEAIATRIRALIQSTPEM